jgi:flagellar protein FliO/FliZ
VAHLNSVFRITSVTRWLLVVVGCAVLATAQPMSAATTDETEPATPSPSSAEKATPAGGQIIYPKTNPERTSDVSGEKKPDTDSLLIVFIALALAGAGAWILIQRRQSGPLAARGQRKLQIDETRPLGNRQYLVVANYDGKKFLLGVTPGQIALLTPLDDAATAREEKKP